MKSVLALIAMLLYVVVTTAQNLVPNPNFALHNGCPNNYGQLDSCKYWYNPTASTPDYFNSCHDTLPGSPFTVGVPNNVFGTQSSASNSYIGIAMLGGSTSHREYARANIPALLPGAIYRVLLKVSLGDNYFYAINAPSVFFYKNMDSVMPTITVLPYLPQITFSLYGHIADKINWVTVTDTFMADSAYIHLIIGNFNNDAMTSKTALPGATTMISYYFIDSISVEKIADPSIVNPNSEASIKASLYPNPFTERAVLNIENLPAGNNTLSIMNVQGVVVREIENIRSGQTVIQREGLPPGFYYYQLQSSGGVVFRDKMVVQ